MEELITRILQERERFVDISEESLKREIENENENNIEDDINSPDSSESTSVPDRLDTETFFNQSQDLTKLIASALNETSLSLDFVSLLLSAIKPNQTMSPHLVKNVPLSSLSSNRLLKQEDEQAAKQKKLQSDLKVGKVWKLQSLQKIQSLFKQASVSLNEQVQSEHTYWNDVNCVLNHDEVLFKTRVNGAKSIGVKYGFGDSGSNYHDKGLALLKKDDSGVSFIPITSSLRIIEKSYKYIRIKILSNFDDDYILSGQSSFNFRQTETTLIGEIEKARYFLFEEDLFYQLTREAKNLINYNVSIISNKIIIEIKNEIIEIESVVYDESDDDIDYQNVNQYSAINNSKCQMILNYLKIMLCCYYNYNLKLKQKMPTNLTKWKQSNTHPLILRPLLGNIRHEINLNEMQSIISNLTSKLDDKFSSPPKLTTSKYINLQQKPTNPFQKSVEKPESKIDLIIQNNQSRYLDIGLILTTNESFVNLIIKLSIVRYQSYDDLSKKTDGVNVLQAEFNDFIEIEESLKWSIMSFIN